MESLSSLASTTARDESRELLLFSDLHLGADLKRRDVRRAGGLARLASTDPLSDEIGALLAHYASQPGPWRLVLAGDVVDFIGINVTPADLGEPAPFELTAEEREYGLEPGPDRSAWIMRLVARRHAAFFEHLGRWVAAGHDVVVIRGNHDAALVFPEVQAAFTESVAAHAPAAAAQLHFEDWFYLEPGRIYVEHGHAHDELSAEPGGQVLVPDRPNRLNQPVSTLTLRYFANRFPTLDLDDVDNWGAWQFVHWALVRENPLRIALAFLQTLAFLLVPRLRRALRQARRARIVAAREGDDACDPEDMRPSLADLVARARARLAKGRKGAEKLANGLARLLRRSGDVGAAGVLRMFFLDRVAVVGSGALLSVSFGAAPLSFTTKVVAIAAAVLVSIALERNFAARRQVALGPKLRAAADELARLADVPLVVMGHSHRAVDTSVAAGTRYVNLGAWAGAARDGGPEGGLPHLVVRGDSADFLRWHGRPTSRN